MGVDCGPAIALSAATGGASPNVYFRSANTAIFSFINSCPGTTSAQKIKGTELPPQARCDNQMSTCTRCFILATSCSGGDIWSLSPVADVVRL